MTRLFSHKDRPVHLGPYPLERLPRVHTASARHEGGVEGLRIEVPGQPDSLANAMVEYVDVMDRMLDLFAIIADAAEGAVRPVISTFDCRMIGLVPTTAEPMRSFVDEFTALETQEGILNVWLGHGFPYGDVPDLGATMVVVTDGDAPRGARQGNVSGTNREKLMRKLLLAAATASAQISSGPIAPFGDLLGGRPEAVVVNGDHAYVAAGKILKRELRQPFWAEHAGNV